LRKFQYDAFAIKTQAAGLPDFFNGRGVTRIARSHHQKESTHATPS